MLVVANCHRARFVLMSSASECSPAESHPCAPTAARARVRPHRRNVATKPLPAQYGRCLGRERGPGQVHRRDMGMPVGPRRTVNGPTHYGCGWSQSAGPRPRASEGELTVAKGILRAFGATIFCASLMALSLTAAE